MYRIHLLFHLMEIFSISFFLLILFRRFFFAILTFVKIAAIQRRRQTLAKNYTFEEECGRAKENMKNDWRTTNTERQQTNNENTNNHLLFFCTNFRIFLIFKWMLRLSCDLFLLFNPPIFFLQIFVYFASQTYQKSHFFTLVYSICVISFTFFVRNGLLDNFIFHIAFTEHLHIT